MLLLLVAAAVGSTGFQIVRALALIRFSTTVNRRLQAAVWDRVMRLRTSFFRRYSVGDLAQRIVGIDDIRASRLRPDGEQHDRRRLLAGRPRP